MSGYAERLKVHLADYKLKRLGVEADGVAVQQRKAYPHILPQNLLQLNVLETVRREFWDYWGALESEGNPLSLHRGFHHLNSSQALTFNLFFPFFGLGRGQSDEFLKCLGMAARNIEDWEFEAVVNQEEYTNFDFLVRFSGGSRLLVEVKLSEKDFGAGRPNEKRRAKLEEIYRPRLESVVAEELLEEEVFFRNYQLLRNISWLRPEFEDELVLLFPAANRGLSRQAQKVLDDVRPETSRRIRVVLLEDLLDGLEREDLQPLIRAHLHLFREKYVLKPA